MLNNVLDFNKELNKNHRKYNPMFSAQIPWIIGTCISTWTNLAIVPMIAYKEYMDIFNEVYFQE